MFNIFRNQFVQALGLGAAVWITLRGIGFALGWILLAIESFSRWYRWVALPLSEEIAVAAAIVYLVGAGIFSSRQN